MEVLKTVATKVRFTVEATGRDGLGVRRQLCVKGYFGDVIRGGDRRSEAYFYRQLARTLTVRCAPCVYRGVDDQAKRGLIIMEDLVAAGAVFLSALSPYSATQAAASLDQLARLHASRWEASPDALLAWLDNPIHRVADLRPPAALDALFARGRGDRRYGGRFITYGYFLWAMTGNSDEEISRTFVDRLGTAAAEHGTFAALGVTGSA